QSLHAVAPTTDADKPERKTAALAFTWTGLQKMGLGKDALATFSAPFREGMYQEDRLRRLGDMISGQWQETVIKGGSRWSANIPARKAKAAGEGSIAEIGGPPELQEREVPTPITVHALLV